MLNTGGRDGKSQEWQVETEGEILWDSLGESHQAAKKGSTLCWKAMLKASRREFRNVGGIFLALSFLVSKSHLQGLLCFAAQATWPGPGCNSRKLLPAQQIPMAQKPQISTSSGTLAGTAAPLPGANPCPAS